MSEIPPPTVPPATPPPPGGGSYTPPPPPPYGGAGGGAPASSDRTLWIVLSYLGILAVIPYFTKKDDPDQEVRWHAKNGMGLFLAELVVWAALFIVTMLLRNSIGCGVGMLQCIVWLGFLVLSIICIMQGISGRRYRIPVVTDMAEKSL